MPIRSGFFNSVNGDRRYKADFFAEYFATFIANGVFPNPSTGFQVISNGDMTVSLKAGKAWINGYYATNDADYVLTLDNADGVLNRIDRVVLQLNYLNREITPIVKKGTPASSPVAPALKRDADAYEIALADVYIGKGVLGISQANITDLRLNTSLCGIVHALIDQVDTTTIFNQYTAWFNSVKDGTEQEISDWQQQVEQTFNDWFDTVKGILEGDVATNLANRIATLEQDFASHQADTTTGAHKAKNITVEDVNNRFTSKDVESVLNELFTFANDGKSKWSSVIGSPLVSTDTFSSMQTKTQTIKNTLATNLTAKGQSSAGTETLTALVNKIANIQVGGRFAKGTQSIKFTEFGGAEFNNLKIRNLAFKPSVVYTYGGGYYYVFIDMGLPGDVLGFYMDSTGSTFVVRKLDTRVEFPVQFYTDGFDFHLGQMYSSGTYSIPWFAWEVDLKRRS